MFGDVRYEAALSHARTRGDDDEVAGLEAAGDSVEVAEPRRHARDLAFRLRDLLEPVDLGLEDRREVAEVLGAVLVGDLEEEALGPLDQFPRLALAVGCVRLPSHFRHRLVADV